MFGWYCVVVSIPGAGIANIPDPSHPYHITNFYVGMPCLMLGFRDHAQCPIFRVKVVSPLPGIYWPEDTVPCRLEECLLNEVEQEVCFNPDFFFTNVSLAFGTLKHYRTYFFV